MASFDEASGVDDQTLDDRILAEYDRERGRYSEFVDKLEELVKSILRAHGVNAHSVTKRVKDRNSLAGKLRKRPGKYSALADVTDVAGIRITTYFEEDVEKVASLIEQEFDVDVENSGDRRDKYDPDRFGYLSWHHVVGLSAARRQLIEYRQFPDLKAEIQTRSILQHAWAEIEHDLGYKSAVEVPGEVRRRFYRLAGLLELADEEFNRLRRDLEQYAQTVPVRIEVNPGAVTINKVSLSAFLETNPLVRQLDEEVGPSPQPADFPQPEVNPRDVDRVLYFGIRTIAQLESALRDNADRIRRFYSRWNAGDPRPSWYRPGKSLFYLGYVLVGQTGSEAEAFEYLNKLGIGSRYEGLQELARRIIETYEAVEAETARGQG